ncbi:hypothetical protein Spirs_3521 [Sediminispirochaeta smaragdinae DSM 11293]|uniref:Uncharacterized protein n=1 Tax=Sediminispirochaeta smaragdinae (strain DSM 11293 / JCM 15392 / SEBR 4228) TaxID=573413 RepID=E1R7A4_SEDSS|nr:hypothetical protein Spirs_3521 [Sediminispirochaeta smaragdinae DSM 11293]
MVGHSIQKGMKRLPDNPLVFEVEHHGCCLVYIYYPHLRVGYDDAGVHLLEDEISGNRHKVKEVESPDTDGGYDDRYGKNQGSYIKK